MPGHHVRHALARLRRFLTQDDAALLLLGAMHAERVRRLPGFTRLEETEFRVYSQWGEDGIIQHLVGRVPIENRTFVEFGVEDYRESNTRFLLRHDDWRGVVIERDPDHVRAIRRDPLHWKHDLQVVEATVTRDNIDALLTGAGVSGDIGLLSIDIDGNDYWVWRAIAAVRPRIVVCEYNSVLGARRPVSIPYDPGFDRTRAHHSTLYWGTSLPALCVLAREKGYTFVGSTRAGINAFFVRSDVADGFRALTAEEGYVESRYRESRDRSGALTFVSGADRLRLIGDMPVVDVVTGETGPIARMLDLRG